MTNIQSMEKLLKNLQQKFNLINEILTYTKELETALNTNDIQVFGLVLDMRQKVMDKVDIIDKENQALIKSLPEPDKEKMTEIFHPSNRATINLNNPLETNIFDTQKRLFALLKKVSIYDDQIKEKVQKKI